MALTKDYEMHTRRLGRNIGLGLTLAAFVAVVFGLTLAKVGSDGAVEGFDHVARPAMIPQESSE